MNKKEAVLIERGFQDAWEEFGDDKSTEFLLAITADRLGVDYGDVVEALAMIHDRIKIRMQKRQKKILCKDCGINYADLPAPRCPGCEAYMEHQA